MTDTKRPSNKLPVIVIFVSLLILLGVYVFTGDKGNDVAANSCDASIELAKQLDDKIGGEIAAFSIASQPVTLSDIKFVDADGADKSLDDFKGKSILVNLWATWCAPCRAEMPSLQQLNKDLGGEKFSVVPISVDTGSIDKPKEFYVEMGLQGLPFYHDKSSTIFNTFKKKNLALGLPATVLLDKKGCVLGKLNGPAEWASQDAKTLINAIIELQ